MLGVFLYRGRGVQNVGQNVQYNLNFSANTISAKAAIQDLFKSLDDVTKVNLDTSNLFADMQKASQSARLLKAHLEDAVNVNTGKLNLNELTRNLKANGTSLEELTHNLAYGGEVGTKAFSSVVNAIAKTEVPLRKTNNLLTDFAVTLKNTAKWQISSDIIHGLEGGLTSAIGYVKDLNTALTDIRIVTGQSSDDMAKFAVRANDAAKALNTTTKEYAKAALIYYQQGNSDKLVNEKAAITIKAANASSDSNAQDMSQYLTAVWNSYQVGEAQLESTVDVMAALGAKTATSMEEIATAMEKVASVGNSVGVSFNQLSSIIATVSSVTRQSAESVGTSFKTILARIGDLKLGKTDEDGVGLGSVSKQLNAMGIHILDATGELRDMGGVVEEIGDKWQGMNKATQTALAQAVAGKRQYTQLVALFDNWQMYKDDKAIAEDSKGALQKMQNTYAESWDAASKKVQSSMEKVYSKLVNDKSMIKILNVTADAIGGVDSFIDALGGIPGILLNIGGIATYVFKDQIGVGLTSLFTGIKQLAHPIQSLKDSFANFKTGKTKEQRDYENTLQSVRSVGVDVNTDPNISDKAKSEIAMSDKLLSAKLQLVSSTSKLSAAQSAAFDAQIKHLASELAQVQNLNQEYLDLKKNSANSAKDAAKAAARQYAADEKTTVSAAHDVLQNNLIASKNTGKLEIFGISQSANSADVSLTKLLEKFEQVAGQVIVFENFAQQLTSIGDSANGVTNGVQLLNDAFEDTKQALLDVGVSADVITRLQGQLSGANPSAGGALSILEPLIQTQEKKQQKMRQILEAAKVDSGVIDEIIAKTENTERSRRNTTTANREQARALDDVNKKMKEASESSGQRLAGALQTGTSAIMGFSNGMNSASTATQAFLDSSSSLTDKIGSVTGAVTGLAMAFATGSWIGLAASLVGMLVGAFQGAAENAKKLRAAAVEELTTSLTDAQDTANANNELLTSFEDLLAKKREGLDVDDEITSKAQELIKAYGATGDAVSSLTGDYEGLIAKIKEQQGIDAQTALTTANANMLKAENVMQDTGLDLSNKGTNGDIMQMALGFDSSFAGEAINNQIQGVIDQLAATGYNGAQLITRPKGFSSMGFQYINTGTSASDFAKEKTDVNQNYLQQNGLTSVSLKDIADKLGISKYFASTYGDANAQLLLSDKDTTNYKLEVYDSIQAFITELESAGLATGDFYNNLKKTASEIEAPVAAYRSAQEFLATATGATYGATFVGKTTKKGESDYMSFNDYSNTRKDMSTKLKNQSNLTDEQIQATIDTVTGTNTEIQQYEMIYQAIDETFKGSTSALNIISDKIAEYGTEIFTQSGLWQSLKDTAASDTESISKIIDTYGQLAEQDSLIGDTSSLKEKAEAIKSKLKAKMSVADVSAIENVADWDQDFGISFSEFLQKSYTEQVKFIDQQAREALEKNIEALKNKKTLQEELLKEMSLTSFGSTVHSGQDITILDTGKVLDKTNANERSKQLGELTDKEASYTKRLAKAEELLGQSDEYLSALGIARDTLTSYEAALREAVATGNDLDVALYEMKLAANDASEALANLTTLSPTQRVEQQKIVQDKNVLSLAEKSYESYGDYSGLNQYAQEELERIVGKTLSSIGQGDIDAKQIELANQSDKLTQTLIDGLSSVFRAFSTTANADGSYSAKFTESQINSNDAVKQYVENSTGKTYAGGDIDLTISADDYVSLMQELDKMQLSGGEADTTKLTEQASALSAMGDNFKKLEDVQTEFVSKTGVTQATLNELRNTLEMTNPAIANAYSIFKEAAQSGDIEAFTKASNDLTTAIITGNGEMLTNNATSEKMLESWKDLYGITDDFGNALSVEATNAIRSGKAHKNLTLSLKNMEKQWSKNNKTIELSGEHLALNSKIYKTIAKEAKKAGQSIEEFVDSSDSFKNLSQNEKDALKYGAQMEDVFTNLRSNIAKDFSKLPEDMQAAIDNSDMDTLLDSLISPSSFGTLLDNIMGGKEQVTAAINGMATDSDAAIAAMGAQLQAAADANGSINLGTVLQNMGVDVSNPIAVLEALVNLLNQLAGTPYFEGASGALGPVQSALSATQALQSKYGGGGGARNSVPSKTSNGGGGGKNKTKKDLVRYKDEIERYHEVEQALDRVGEKLDKIDKMKERTYGKKHIAQIDAEIAALQEEIDVQEQYLSEANSNISADKADVTALGATFDENGNINNYEEVMASALNTYNAAIERFNNSAQGDGDQARLDAAQQAYEDAKTAIDNYEESLAKAAESEEALLDLQNQISQLALEKITYKVEIQTTLNDSDLQILEYFQKKYEEVLGSQDEMMSSLMASASEYEDNLSIINSAIATLNAQYAAGTINEADYVSGMEDLNSQLLDNLNNLEELNDSIKEVYGNTLSQATSDLEAQTNQMTRMTTAMQSYITLLGLMGHGTNYEELQQFYDAQYTSNMASIQTQRAYYEQLLVQEEYFRQRREQNGSLSETEQAQYDALEETITSVHETLMDETEQTLSTLQDAYQNTINAMFKSLDEFMAGTEGSLANLADNYSYFQETQERYVSTSKELYEVSKLNRQIEQSISDSTTVASKAALKALQAKIDKQSELNELTEYDIEMNQLEYQLALAQIALDEAKNAKDTVRLTRDENGNYAYQYTANQEKLNEAEQQYEDVLQQINELAGNRISELEQSFIDAQSKYQQAALEIASDMSLTEAERAEKLATLSQQYNETLLYIQQQYGNATEALGSNQEAVAERYGATLSSLTASAAANVNSTIGAMIQNTQSYIDHMTAVIGPTGTAQTAWQSYIARIQSVSAAAGTSYDEMTSQIAAYAATTQQASTAANAILSTLQSTLPAVNALTSAWIAHQTQIQTTISYYERLTQQINASISAMQRLSGNSSSNSSSSSTRNTSSVTQYATGGLADYTGPAWLDGSTTQPELVLNSEDTKNTLATVESVRKIDVATLALVADTLNNAAASMMSYLGNSFHASGVSSNDNSLEQNVEIHAEFPNATNHTEIEEAFDNLINRAAQYANRKQ